MKTTSSFSLTSKDTEALVVSACVGSKDRMVKLLSDTREQDYADLYSREIYRAMARIHRDGQTPTLYTLEAVLNSASPQALNPYILDDCRQVDDTEFGQAIQRVRELSWRRRVDDVLSRCQKSLVDLTSPSPVIAQEILSLLGPALRDYRREVCHSLPDISKEWSARLNSKQQFAVPVLFPGLDFLVGIEPGELVYLASRPAVGKSAMAIQWVRHLANQGIPVLLVTLEMSRIEVFQRMMAQELQVPTSKLTLSHLDKMNVRQPIWVIDHSLDIQQLENEVRNIQLRSGLGALFIDYFELLRVPGEGSYDSLSELSRGLKRLAVDMEVPVICLHQINRQTAHADRRPRMEDLRYVGEMDANKIFFLHRKIGESGAELIVEKNRSGATGSLRLEFLQDTVTFKEAK